MCLCWRAARWRIQSDWCDVTPDFVLGIWGTPVNIYEHQHIALKNKDRDGMKGGILCGYKDIFVVRNRGKIFQESAFFFFHNCLFVLFVLQTDPVSTLIGVYIHLVTHEKHDPRCLKSQGPEGQESVNTSKKNILK